MSAELTLRIGEIRVEADPACTDLAALQRALEAAMTELGRRLQALLAGRDGLPEVMVIPDILVTDETAKSMLREPDFGRLVDTLEAELEARLRGVP